MPKTVSTALKPKAMAKTLDLRDQCHRFQGHKIDLEANAIKLTSRRLEALHIAGLKIACSYDKNVQLQFKNMQLIVK